MIAELFATSVRKCTSNELGVGELLSAIDTLTRAGERQLVVELYKIWIGRNADHPLLYAIHFNYGVVLTDNGDIAGARSAFMAAIDANANFIPAYINLGNAHERLGANDQAIEIWSKAAERLGGVTGEAIQHKTTALKQIGRVFEGAKLETNAEEILRRSLEINPRQRDVVQHWIALRQSQCKWPVLCPELNVAGEELLQSISPLSLAAYDDDPILQLANAHHYNRHDVKPSGISVLALRGPSVDRAEGRLRIGYLSSDLREHAVGFLMSEVFSLHDRKSVDVFAYYCGIPSNDATHTRFKNTVDHWRDISGVSDEDAATMMVADGIDILVDLNGYTKDARLKLVAMRPAPIIVNWLGFPGTMGSPYHNYIVADPFTIPSTHEIYYSEKVVRLPCYQPNDRMRAVSSIRPSRVDAGLPERAFVYCCFNGTQKISPQIFEIWMAILRRTENSVLWLLAGTGDTNDRLKELAERSGVSGDRLIFAPRKPNAEHLARYHLADLFLDTFPYGAHTTASDALWMGVPVVTVPGQSFASRVCGSLVLAAGLGELVCTTQEAYIAKAIELCTTPKKLETLKWQLAKSRDTCILFDTPRLVQSLERLYTGMWADFVRGDLPSPDLSNLDMLHQVGCEILAQTRSSGLSSDSRPHYRRRLAERHAFLQLQHDPRLQPCSAKNDGGATLSMAVEADQSRSPAQSLRKAAPALRGPASSEVGLQ